MTNPQAGQGLASRLEALVSYPHARSRSRGRKRCPDLSCTCVGTKGCEQQLGREEDCGRGGEKDGGEVKEEEDSENSPEATENTGDTDNEGEVSKEVAEKNNNEEDKSEEEEVVVGSNLMPKEMMMSFQPSMEDLVEMIEESGVMEDKELAAQLHFVVSYFIRVTSKQMKK